ncbi:bifunctional 2-polyprenyl-6-hydroxyphenol methylase/3-demethylubiquinol 3-O-methyltransferase UbiG [Actinomycetospora sp. TBRC 11914]|uniref:class I SAM-dependent methyltransferase n=1 Tax=Actinomycetospora sp. TBRC 11914 TaxID=2729387 RepID=UPI00145D1EF9|nr:class I SAM-dependent methyltransferase [Actinomycetospora sp. TBRC 11914]NMO91228.1 class I SAM-dependent methyltransferase [Actinomycetospora sp. TBRC 11914]
METAETLPLTGERTVPGIRHENYWFRRHEAVYRALAGDCRGATVLEAGVGEGYGAALLGGVADRVIALELDTPTAAHVARRYGGALHVVRADLAALPLPDAAVDVVVTLQVIEHLWDQPGFLRECARVLRPGGRLHCSTPNRLTFSPGNALTDRPLNPFHTYELAATDLAALVHDAGLAVTTLRGLHHGARLAERDARHGGSLVDAQVALAVSGEPWPDRLADDVAQVGVEEFDLHADDVDASLDLVVSAVRPA